MSIEIHANAIYVAIAALESNILGGDIGYFALMGFADQKDTRALARTVLEARSPDLRERGALS